MGIAEEYVRMEGWAHVVQTAGLGCDGRPGTVYELATLIMTDSEVQRLQQATYNPAKAQERMDAKLDAILHDKPIPDEPFESDLVGVLLSMSPEQRQAYAGPRGDAVPAKESCGFMTFDNTPQDKAAAAVYNNLPNDCQRLVTKTDLYEMVKCGAPAAKPYTKGGTYVRNN